MKNIKPQGVLEECAACLISSIESPSVFLNFLNDVTYSMYRNSEGQDFDSGKDVFFTMRVLIEDLIITWIDSVKDPQAGITRGLKKVYDYCGTEGFERLSKKIFEGFAWSCLNENFPFDDHLQIPIKGLRGISYILDGFREYECVTSLREGTA